MLYILTLTVKLKSSGIQCWTFGQISMKNYMTHLANRTFLYKIKEFKRFCVVIFSQTNPTYSRTKHTLKTKLILICSFTKNPLQQWIPYLLELLIMIFNIVSSFNHFNWIKCFVISVSLISQLMHHLFLPFNQVIRIHYLYLIT